MSISWPIVPLLILPPLGTRVWRFHQVICAVTTPMSNRSIAQRMYIYARVKMSPSENCANTSARKNHNMQHIRIGNLFIPLRFIESHTVRVHTLVVFSFDYSSENVNIDVSGYGVFAKPYGHQGRRSGWWWTWPPNNLVGVRTTFRPPIIWSTTIIFGNIVSVRHRA